MAVPKKKISKSKRNSRRAHDSLKPMNIVFDSTTGEPKLPHRMSVDNYYKGRQVIAPKLQAENKGEETPAAESA